MDTIIFCTLNPDQQYILKQIQLSLYVNEDYVMSIFDRKPVNRTNQTTEGFYFGKSESEGEDSYKNSDDTLFDDYLDIMPKIGEGCFIITGRKGSGKSAIAKYIKDNASFEDSMFCEIVKLDAIKLEKHIQQNTEESEEKLVSFFQWLILVKLVKLILEAKNGEYTAELKAIKNFVRNNSGIVEIDKFSVAEITAIKKQEFNLGAFDKIPRFKAIIERVMGKRLVKAPYYKLLPALKEIVYKVLEFPVFRDYHFVIVFDDLDIGFKSDDYQDKQSLMELIRSAKEFNNDLRDKGNAKILILIRDDIKKILEGFAADASKIFSSYEVELKWYDGNNENQTRLRKFVNRRIEFNFKQRGLKYIENDPWCSLINDNEGCYGVDYNGFAKSAFKQILDYTFLRPRDLILFLRNIGAGNYYYPINGQIIGCLLQKYAHDNVSEIKSELSIRYSQHQIGDIFNILRALSYLQNIGFGKGDILTKLVERGFDEETLRILIDYYIIIPFDSSTGRYYIGYRNSDPSDYDISKDNIKYKLHKCIYAHFVPKSTLPMDA